MDRTGRLRDNLNRVVEDLHLQAPPAKETIADRRRRRTSRPRDRACRMVVTRRDGVLFLQDFTPVASLGGGRRRARTVTVGGEVVERVELERLPRSSLVESIRKLDFALTGGKAGGTEAEPSFGLRRIRRGQGPKAVIERVPEPIRKGRVLLLVHGTFSHTDAILDDLMATREGRRYLGHVLNPKTYDEVLTFDHPTLGVSPWLNARELQLLFRNSAASVDVICHSRGGLVTRWWLEALDKRPPARRRAVFVGAPLFGTSLAAPPKLPMTLNLLLNLAHRLDKFAAAASFLATTTGIFQILASTTRLLGAANRVDAVVAMIPGLAAQSRVGNNPELESLRKRVIQPERYFAVQSNFEPKGEGWKFWRYFRKDKSELLKLGADWAIDPIFDGPNDLVVDTISMADFTEQVRLPDDHVHDFGRSGTVLHTNYFRQKKTLEFLREKGF